MSEAALAVARTNAAALKSTTGLSSCWAIGASRAGASQVGGPFDLLVSNPPYIEADAIAGLMPEVSRFEPRLALDGGADGLAAYRAIAAEAPRLVTPDGRLLLEVGEGQAPEIYRIFQSTGFTPEAPGKTSAASTGWSL